MLQTKRKAFVGGKEKDVFYRQGEGFVRQAKRMCTVVNWKCAAGEEKTVCLRQGERCVL